VDGTRSVMRATAPAVTAAPTNRRPSSCAPASAPNRSPGLTSRLSPLTPVMSSAAERGALTAASGRGCAGLLRAAYYPDCASDESGGSSNLGSCRASAPLARAAACEDQLLRWRQLVARLDPEQRRDPPDHCATDRHGVPAGRGKAVGLGDRLRLVEHDEQSV